MENLKPLFDFVKKFGIGYKDLHLDEKYIKKIKNGYFYDPNPVLDVDLSDLDIFYSGELLGRVVKGKFVPSLDLLNRIAKVSYQKVRLDEKKSWLFICGRDVLGFVKPNKKFGKRKFVLVENEKGEIIGYGFIKNENPRQKDVWIKNLWDIGDYLRRELTHKKE